MNNIPVPLSQILLRLLPSGMMIACLSLVSSAFGQAAPSTPTGGLISETRFNDSTGVTLKNGAALGPDGSGVSGKPGDKAYVADLTNAPTAIVIPSGSDVSAADELTVTVWYKPKSSDMKDAQTLFNAFGSQLLWDGRASEWMWRVGSQVTGNPAGKTWYSSGKNPPPIVADQWTFIAMTWKRSDNTATYYMGTLTTPPASSHKVTRKDAIDPAKESKRAIGNDPAKTDRAFNGSIDNVRFYTKALDEAALTKIYSADLKNETVSIP